MVGQYRPQLTYGATTLARAGTVAGVDEAVGTVGIPLIVEEGGGRQLGEPSDGVSYQLVGGVCLDDLEQETFDLALATRLAGVRFAHGTGVSAEVWVLTTAAGAGQGVCSRRTRSEAYQVSRRLPTR